MFFSPLTGMMPAQYSLPTLVTLPPSQRPQSFCNHSSQTKSPPNFASGTYATIASCSPPAENTILPMAPDPPLRSSSDGSDFSFMASTDFISNSRSPCGSSTDVQKNWRPPMSAAPSISTPRLPPSLMTFFNNLAGSSLGFFFSSGLSADSFSFFS